MPFYFPVRVPLFENLPRMTFYASLPNRGNSSFVAISHPLFSFFQTASFEIAPSSLVQISDHLVVKGLPLMSFSSPPHFYRFVFRGEDLLFFWNPDPVFIF